MASTRRRSPRHLSAEIRENASAFRFFQAIRLLSLSAPAEDVQQRPIPGHIRFQTPISLSFPASEIQEIEEENQPANSDTEEANEQVPRLRMTVGFMGMTGPSGVLPTAYTELLVERRHLHRDSTARDFFDIFSHRAITLFYQAWHKHRFYLPFESKKSDHFSRNLLDLVGIGLGKLQERLQKHGQGIPDRFLVHYAGLLAQKPISAINIAALVRGYFGVEAIVEQYIGQWLMVPENEQTQIGYSGCSLGQDSFLGERQWDRQTKIRIKIGPLRRQQFNELLPGNPGASALRELIQFCIGHSLTCDAQLILHKADIPRPMLQPDQLRLGHNTWLNNGPTGQHADHVHYTLLK